MWCLSNIWKIKAFCSSTSMCSYKLLFLDSDNHICELQTLTPYAKKLAKIIPTYIDMLGLFYLIRSSSYNKPRGGG